MLVLLCTALVAQSVHLSTPQCEWHASDIAEATQQRRARVQAATASMPEARFRASAAHVQLVDGDTAVAVFGGHHRCQRNSNFENADDDGGCIEIGHASMYLVDTATPPVFVCTNA
jgi:hypothetical protein